jgi:hypothetical protein
MTTRHLRPAELMDFAEGRPIPRPKSVHLGRCERCREEAGRLVSILGMLSEASFDEVSPAGNAMQPEWSRLRDSVRNQLLGRAVRRSGSLSKRLGAVFAPRPAWGVALAVLVLAAVLAGVGADRAASPTTSPESREDALFLDDPTALEAESMAWSEPEIFVSLNELDESEEEALLELIAVTFGGDGI